MGSFLTRSSSSRAERQRKNPKRGKRERLEPIETAFEADKFTEENHRMERKLSDSNTLDTYARWNHRQDQQNLTGMNGSWLIASLSIKTERCDYHFRWCAWCTKYVRYESAAVSRRYDESSMVNIPECNQFLLSEQFSGNEHGPQCFL